MILRSCLAAGLSRRYQAPSRLADTPEISLSRHGVMPDPPADLHPGCFLIYLAAVPGRCIQFKTPLREIAFSALRLVGDVMRFRIVDGFSIPISCGGNVIFGIFCGSFPGCGKRAGCVICWREPFPSAASHLQRWLEVLFCRPAEPSSSGRMPRRLSSPPFHTR